MKIKIKRGVLIYASVQELAASAVANLIGQKEYSKIKATDKHPMFIKLDVGKQGVSKGPVILGGIKKMWNKIWSATRIKELGKWLNRDIALFEQHNADNSHDGRRQIGRTLKGWSEEQSDGEHAYAVAYIPSENSDVQESIRNKTLDTCSLEANLRFVFGKFRQLFVNKIQELTGIALGDATMSSPGFASAGIVGVVQEMSDIEDTIAAALEEAGIDPEDVEFVNDDKNKKTKIRRKKMGGDEITLEDVQAYVRKMKVQPDVIYQKEELLSAKIVSDAMTSEIAENLEALGTKKDELIAALKVTIEENKTAIETANAALKTKEDEFKQKLDAVKPLQQQARQKVIGELVSKSSLLKDTPQEQMDYIMSHVTLPMDEDLDSKDISDKVDVAVQSQIDDIKKYNIQFEEPVIKPDDENINEGDFDVNPLVPKSAKKKE